MTAGQKKQLVKITFVDDDVTAMTDTFSNTRKRKLSEEDSFECDAGKLRRGVRAAQPDLDSTQSTLCESSMVTRIRNRMRKGRLGLGMYLSIPKTKLKYNYII